MPISPWAAVQSCRRRVERKFDGSVGSAFRTKPRAAGVVVVRLGRRAYAAAVRLVGSHALEQLDVRATLLVRGVERHRARVVVRGRYDGA